MRPVVSTRSTLHGYTEIDVALVATLHEESEKMNEALQHIISRLGPSEADLLRDSIHRHSEATAALISHHEKLLENVDVAMTNLVATGLATRKPQFSLDPHAKHAHVKLRNVSVESPAQDKYNYKALPSLSAFQ